MSDKGLIPPHGGKLVNLIYNDPSDCLEVLPHIPSRDYCLKSLRGCNQHVRRTFRLH